MFSDAQKKLFLLAIEESEGSIYIYFKSVRFRMVINYFQSKARRSWRRMTRLKLTLPSWLWHLEIELSERNSLYFTWPAQSRYSSRLRWRALPAAEAALAANGAAVPKTKFGGELTHQRPQPRYGAQRAVRGAEYGPPRSSYFAIR